MEEVKKLVKEKKPFSEEINKDNDHSQNKPKKFKHFKNKKKSNQEKPNQEKPPYQFNNENKKEMQDKQDSNVQIKDIKQASEVAKEKLSDALNKKSISVISVSKEGDNWNAIIEIIEEEYLPGKNLASMNDIIGMYEVSMSSNGDLLSWTKKSSRKRGNTS